MRSFLILLLAGNALAGEVVILGNGFRLVAERHETASGSIRLHTKNGVIEIPAGSVESIEADESSPEESVADLAPAESKEPAVTPTAPIHPKQLVEDAALRWGLPPEFLHSVARVESSYRANALSPKGAIGIMQLMPATAKLLDADPYDPAQNVDAGARHLRDLLIQYDGQSEKALAAYNAGQAAVARYGGVPPYAETVLYVQKVLRQYEILTRKPLKK